MHIDYCRGEPHDNPELLHINERMVPNPDQEKDWITHGLHWRRSGELVPRSFQYFFIGFSQVSKVPETTIARSISNV